MKNGLWLREVTYLNYLDYNNIQPKWDKYFSEPLTDEVSRVYSQIIIPSDYITGIADGKYTQSGQILTIERSLFKGVMGFDLPSQAPTLSNLHDFLVTQSTGSSLLGALWQNLHDYEPIS